MKTVVLASGGTGGHIFPAEALAVELTRRGYRPVLITDDRYKSYKDSKENNLEIMVVKSSSLGGNIIRKMKSVTGLGIGFLQARKILKKLKPHVVVGFGGYPSFPTMYAAGRLKMNTIIHEQNSMLGRANYVLSSRVGLIATSFEKVSGILEEDNHKVRFTGNPVRNAVKAIRDMEYPDLSDSGILRILVTGGSQGASVFSSVVPEAIALLPENFRERIRVDQQCRAGNIEDVRQKYKELGVSADLATFFNDLPLRLASSHLVISRSGASTLAEIEVAGRPVIMIPYPHSMDDHQRINANALEEVGGGWVMPEETFTASTLAAKIESFMNLPSILTEAAEASRRMGKPDADKRLADLVDEMACDVEELAAKEQIAEDVDGLSKLDEMETKS